MVPQVELAEFWARCGNVVFWNSVHFPFTSGFLLTSTLAIGHHDRRW